MATQQYIIEQEKFLIEAAKVVRELRAAVKIEANMGEGRVYSENRDCWGTVWLNAISLKNESERLVEELRKAGGFR